MNNHLKKCLGVFALSFFLTTASSCNLGKYFLKVEPLTYNILAEKGSGSLALCAYYYDIDEHLFFSSDQKMIEEAFNKGDSDGDYQIIVYDAVRGLDLCKQYDKFAYVGTLASGNQQLVPLKEIDIATQNSFKILANNEFGSLGKTIKKALTPDKYQITFTEDTDLELYNKLYEGTYIDQYDYCFISEPFAMRLMTLKTSKLYNQKFDEYTSNEDRGHEISKKMYCTPLKTIYLSTNQENQYSNLGIPQTAIFVNKNAYENNKESMDKVFDLINKEIANKYVRDVNYTRADFRNLSEEFNDPNEDMESEQTQKAFEVQFNKVGISWNEASRLQAWHTVLGQNASFEKFINRLCYVKDIFSYYNESYIKAYYEFIEEDYPGESYFIEIK